MATRPPKCALLVSKNAFLWPPRFAKTNKLAIKANVTWSVSMNFPVIVYQDLWVSFSTVISVKGEDFIKNKKVGLLHNF